MNGSISPGAVWWGQLGRSLRLAEAVCSCLRDCRTAVLRGAGSLPWREDFYIAVDTARTSFSGSRRLKRLPWEPGMDPGVFIMEEFCSRNDQAAYWPGMTRAAWLASRTDLTFGDHYVWVTGIESGEDLDRWLAFAGEYRSALKDPSGGASFVLEYGGPDPPADALDCGTDPLDQRVFCLEMSSALDNASSRSAQAELALSIGGGSPEVCAALLARGEKLLKKPVITAMEVFRTGSDSRGIPFPSVSREAVESRVWQAQLVLLYPVLERRRYLFVEKHAETLYRHLPIHNSNGDTVKDPSDLELGGLCYITAAHEKDFPPGEAAELRLCRRVRNALAHNSLVQYQDLRAVLALGEQMSGGF